MVRRNKTIVFTNGCFDIIHAGHIHLLSRAKLLGDYLIVGLDDDKTVKENKSRLVNSVDDRKAVLEAIKYVDEVIVFSGQDELADLVRTICPDILVKGGDYTKDEIVGRCPKRQTMSSGSIVEDNGGEVIIVPRLKNLSTSLIYEQIKKDSYETTSVTW